MSYKVGIVGGSGFIGSPLVKHLSDKFHIKVLDLKRPKETNKRIDYVHCNIRHYAAVKKGLKDVDLVIHTAIVQIPLVNEKKRLGYEVNIKGTQNVCETVVENPKIKGMILTRS